MNDLVIDVFEFCRLKDRREGKTEVTDLTRLAGEVIGDSGVVSWVLQGGSDSAGHPRLVLDISGIVKLSCQRCLGSLDFVITSSAKLVIAKDEEEADRIDEVLADDDVDVIVGTKTLLITDLIEDEALLSIPLSVKHDVCPKSGIAALDAAKKPSAFAALKDLKR
ncbi:YceD family protein [Actimicrobium sp. CCC2.4]|uniref:YceD family protein n=1 Tax=Actimicrobium sp. CCC2.4 TaxID=3048606 RepID=UPI002AC8FF3C|nr:YceD family protein [Actimicrobium sp. CCC2.4]MEB0135579.1 YceD family protein [Actimicrobium sp. CCC2.4]WPX33857.1 YceD family protein [Actimicrobium sp. CCC2.4]